MTQKDYADQLGVDATTLRKYELGINVPGGLVMARLSAHGLNVNWLLLGEDGMLRQSAGRVLSNETASRIVHLTDAMERLYSTDSEKFDMLMGGFIARCEEATHLAQLEKRLDARTESQKSNLDSPDPSSPE